MQKWILQLKTRPRPFAEGIKCERCLTAALEVLQYSCYQQNGFDGWRPQEEGAVCTAQTQTFSSSQNCTMACA